MLLTQRVCRLRLPEFGDRIAAANVRGADLGRPEQRPADLRVRDYAQPPHRVHTIALVLE